MSVAEVSQSIDAPPIIETLRETIATGVHERAISEAVAALRTSNYGIFDFLSECDRLKSELRATDPAHSSAGERAIDSIVAAVMQATACVHEAVLEHCPRGFATLDAAGRIVYANHALLSLEPNLVGRQLRDLFPDSRETIDDTLNACEPRGSLRLDMHTASGPIPVTGDVGFARVGGNTVVPYALIGDIRPYVEAQIAGFHASPFGILRIDRRRRVKFI